MATNIFISYRKDDSKWNTQLLYDRLTKYFPEKFLFKDFNTIKAGEDYRASINKALSKCHILLVIIGKSWLHAKDENDADRLQNPQDLVRVEIATALARNIRVIPVLFDNITIPAQILLPEDLQALSLRQSVSVSETNFDYDIKHLVEAIKNKHLDKDDSKINLAKILQYRTVLTVAFFIFLSYLITIVLGFRMLRSQYIIIAGLTSFIISLLVSSLLKNKVQRKTKSRLQILCISILILFVATVAFHIYYFQLHTFIYNGFSGKSAYYIKGKELTHYGDSLKNAHPNMTEADILKKLLGGTGYASSLWVQSSIISARLKILFSYTAAMLFLSLFISLLLEILAMKYKPDQ